MFCTVMFQVTLVNSTDVANVLLEGSSEVAVLVNSAPSGGSMQVRVSYLEGVSLEQQVPVDVKLGNPVDILNDDFIADAYEGSNFFQGGFQSMLHSFALEATGWTDDDQPLTFSFIYTTSALCSNPSLACEDYSVIIPSQPSTFSSGILPQANGEEILYLGVIVTDYYQAETKYFETLGLVINSPDTGYLAANEDVFYNKLLPPVEYAVQRQRRGRRALLSMGMTLPTIRIKRRRVEHSRRQLLQDSATISRIASSAIQLKELIFDPAVSALNLKQICQFMDSWGRSYGRYEGNYIMSSDSCNNVDPDIRDTKDSVIMESLPIFQDNYLTSSSLQQYVCSVTKLTWAPGEISNFTQASLVEVVNNNILQNVIESWYVLPAPNLDQLILERAGDCFFDFVNLLLRQTTIACYDPTREANQGRMDLLSNMAFTLGTQLARERTIGSNAIMYLGQYIAMTVQRVRPKVVSRNRQWDVEGAVQNADDQVEFEFKTNLVDGPKCSNNTDDQIFEVCSLSLKFCFSFA